MQRMSKLWILVIILFLVSTRPTPLVELPFVETIRAKEAELDKLVRAKQAEVEQHQYKGCWEPPHAAAIQSRNIGIAESVCP
jgi:hypothetical protein